MSTPTYVRSKGQQRRDEEMFDCGSALTHADCDFTCAGCCFFFLLLCVYFVLVAQS